MQMRYILFLVLFIGSSLSSNAQSETEENEVLVDISTIQVLAERSAEAITLRWAPSSPSLWLAGNRYGYRVQRMVIDDNNYDTDLFVMLGSTKVTSVDFWKETVEKEQMPKYLSVAGECIHAPFKSLEMGDGMGAWVAQSEELQNKYSFALFAADMEARTADFSGLRWEDKRIEQGKQYVYKISINLPEEAKISASPGIVLVDDKITEYPAVLLDVEEEEQSVVLRWLREPYIGKYTAYHVERAPKGGSFQRLDEDPFVHGIDKDSSLYNPYYVYIDSVANYRAYDYRVVGITPFGEERFTELRYTAMGRDKTAPSIPEIIEAKNTEGSTIKIRWEYSGASDLKGFNIYRGHKYEDNYYKINETLLSKNTREFTDPDAFILDRNYYYVNAVDTAGNIATSIVAYGLIEDTISPSPPIGLEGSIDSNGVVNLVWDRNTEKDILGYKVFFANADYHEFSLISGTAFSANSFQDTVTLKTLTRNAYYRVIAVDRRYNYSKMSDILEVKRPDTIPPTAPLFTDYSVEKEAIQLTWANSHSNDVDRHILYRRTGKGNWQILKEFTEKENKYSDSMIEEGRFYSYKIIAVDEAGLYSKAANPLVLQAVHLVLKPAIKTLRIETAQNDKDVNLNWSYPMDGTYRFVVYRAEENGGFEILKVLRSDEKEWVDKKTMKGKAYRYTVQVEFSDGTHSKFSPVVVK